MYSRVSPAGPTSEFLLGPQTLHCNDDGGTFYKQKTSMDQKFIKQRVIIDFVYSWWCPVRSFTDVSFTMVVYGENAFLAASSHWG